MGKTACYMLLVGKRNINESHWNRKKSDCQQNEQKV